MIKNILVCIVGSLILAFLIYTIAILGILFVRLDVLFLNPFEWDPVGRCAMFIFWVAGSLAGTSSLMWSD